MRARTVAARTVAAVLAAALATVTGCSAQDDGPSDEEAGALAAARAYVDAIAALDVEAADAMTVPEKRQRELRDPSESSVPERIARHRTSVDITDALPGAEDPITDPWVSLVSPTYDARQGAVEYVVDVSYELSGLTGGDTITVRLDEDADPSEVGSWKVTDPMIVEGDVYADSKTVPTVRFGEVEVRMDLMDSSHRGVWGYPAGYLVEPGTSSPQVDPLWVAVGAPDAAPWDDSLPMLEPRDQE